MTLSPQKIDFEKTWLGLSIGIGKIITLTGVKGMPIYEDIYRVCTAQPHPHHEELYFKLKQYLENHVDSIARTLSVCHVDLLSEYLKAWNTYSVGMEYCHHIFKYLNSTWIKKKTEEFQTKLATTYPGIISSGSSSSNCEIYEVFTLAMVIWRDHLFLKLSDRILRSVLAFIEQDRNGEQVNHAVISGIISSYVKLGSINKKQPFEIYREHFESHFLSTTRNYYAMESSAFIATNGISSFMKKAEERLEEEKLRTKRFLDNSSFDKVKRECEFVLIDKHKEAILAECGHYLKDNKLEDLSRMYRLLTCTDDGIKPMLEMLQNHITNVGFDVIRSLPSKEVQEPKPYVEAILEVYDRFNDIVRKAFNNDPLFVVTLDKACRTIINENPINKNTTKSPELLAKYCDVLLKKGGIGVPIKALEDHGLEEKLNQIITIFKYVDDKDVFQKFYSKMLARRLIHATSISDDAESIVIGGLKQACGFEYTSKLQRMFTDVSLSSDINEKFREYLAKESLDVGKVDFSALVLTAGSWPLQVQLSNFNIPIELERCVKHFQAYYSSQHHGRKLTWLHHLSKGDLRSFGFKKRYEFQVTNYQIAVLLLFNGADCLSTESIINSTNLKDVELKRTLMSLIESKLVVVVVNSDATNSQNFGGDFLPTTQFVLNTQFSSKRLKLKLTGVFQKETKQENEDTHKGVEDDRRLYLQASIVRIMKTRKVLSHVALVQEVIMQANSRFQPNVPMIKRCIEHLIEKDYLIRIEGDTDKYQYVA